MKKISDTQIILNELNGKNDWMALCINYIVSEEMLDKFNTEINWRLVSKYQNVQRFSHSFIEKYKNKIQWVCVLLYSTVTEDFVRRHEHIFNKEDWEYISKGVKLSESFMEEYVDKIDWKYISRNQKMSATFIAKHFHQLDLRMLISNPKVPPKVRNAGIDKYYGDDKLKMKGAVWNEKDI